MWIKKRKKGQDIGNEVTPLITRLFHCTFLPNLTTDLVFSNSFWKVKVPSKVKLFLEVVLCMVIFGWLTKYMLQAHSCIGLYLLTFLECAIKVLILAVIHSAPWCGMSNLEYNFVGWESWVVEHFQFYPFLQEWKGSKEHRALWKQIFLLVLGSVVGTWSLMQGPSLNFLLCFLLCFLGLYLIVPPCIIYILDKF